MHLNAIQRRASKDVVQPEDRFSWYRAHDHVESYMLHQGKKFTDRFDANTYLRICEMWSQYDPVIDGNAVDTDDLFARSREAGHQYLVFSIDEDYCFYPEEQAALVRLLKESDVSHIYLTCTPIRGMTPFYWSLTSTPLISRRCWRTGAENRIVWSGNSAKNSSCFESPVAIAKSLF